MAACRRVLSVQSHVVHGYVGNRAAVFPLQLLGFEVDVINSVQFCCHGGYPDFSGQRLDGDDLRTLVQGLATNQVLNHSYLLTGYIGTASFLREVIWLRRMLPSNCCYLCDPVLGDNGALYVPEELVNIYRMEVLPHVAILTPNQFEAELLAQTKISNIAQAAVACDALHALGPKMVVLTSLEIPDATCEGQSVAMMLSEAQCSKWLLRLPRIAGGPFAGTGDLAAAMILAWTQLHLYEAPVALEKTGAVLQEVLRRTVSVNMVQMIGGKHVPPELRIIDCKKVIEVPPVVMRCRLVDPLNILGVVFNLVGAIAHSDVKHCVEQLKSNYIHVGIITQSNPERADIADILTVPQGTNKPNVTPLLHCISMWGIDPSSTLVVVNTIDDINCSKAAGIWTVAMLESNAGDTTTNKALAEAADFTISTFDALQRFFYFKPHSLM